MLISINAQDSTAKIDKLKQLNQLVVVKYKEGDMKDATKVAHSALDLTTEIFGTESKETAISSFNLGEIYKARKKYEDAAKYLKQSLAIYQLNAGENESKIAQILESLGVVLTYDGKIDEAEKMIEESIKIAENSFGSEDKKIIPYLKTANYFYIFAEKPLEAVSYFARRSNLTSKIYGGESYELENVRDEFDCFVDNFNSNDKDILQKKFYSLISVKNKEKKEKSDSDDQSIEGGVINGKAISLPKPNYPSGARARGARGKIIVRVLIDVNGDVIRARAICSGDEDLQRASENAAIRAKFKPTLLSGKPVKVTGIISYVYN